MNRRTRESCAVFPLLFTIVCLLFLISSAPALAAPVANDNEVEISGGLVHSEGTDTGNLNLDLSYGYYLSPGWQVGIRQALNYNFIEDQRDEWDATTSPFLAYHFRLTDTVIPHVGGFLGIKWNDRDVTGTIGPQAGVKFFFSPQAYFGVRYRYEWFFNKFERINNNSDDGTHVFNIGLGYVWGGTGPRK